MGSFSDWVASNCQPMQAACRIRKEIADKRCPKASTGFPHSRRLRHARSRRRDLSSRQSRRSLHFEQLSRFGLVGGETPAMPSVNGPRAARIRTWHRTKALASDSEAPAPPASPRECSLQSADGDLAKDNGRGGRVAGGDASSIVGSSVFPAGISIAGTRPEPA